MIYNLESYYFRDPDFPLQKTELVVAVLVSRWATGYSARLLAPVKGIRETKREGKLPEGVKARKAFVADIVKWIHKNSAATNVFSLFLYETYPPNEKDQVLLFDHHDTSSSWGLNMSEEQFRIFQQDLKDHDLPADLFYPSDKTVCIPYKLFGIIPGERCYSPKEWEENQQAHLNK